MRIGTLLLGLAMLSQSTFGAEEMTKAKDLHLNTVLIQGGRPGAIIVAPSAPGYAAVVDIVQEKIKELSGATLPVKSPAELTDDDLKQFNIIALGNVPDSEFVRRLYRERWIDDAWYPFDERFVVRSIHNPYGHGKNILFIGGENPVPVRAAAEKFVGMLKAGDPLSVGWIMTFETEKRGAPISEKQIADYRERAQKALGFKNGRSLISSAASAARSYYYSGQEGWAEIFKIFVKAHKEIGAPGMGTHMNVYDTIAWWDLIEESPAFSDEDRLFVANHFLYIMRSNEGANHSFFRKGTQTVGVRHNHQTLPGLACLFGGRYFKRGYQLPEADEWLAAAKKLFDAQKISHKPQCDCNLYEWGTLYQTAWWSLASRDYSFLENGSYRAAADRAILEMDNLGNCSLNGDCWSPTYFPTILFEQVAEFYKDGRYEWAIRKHFSDDANPERRGVPNLVRGIEPKEPTDLLGIKVAPMSEHFYRAHDTTMPDQPAPNIPIDESFDKMSFRTTFHPEDQYLLLDGIGMGSHGHVDVNGVSHFTANARVWLMDMSYAEGPNMRDHNVVTVLRDGLTAPPPPLAALKGIADLETFGFCETALPKYCGLDWRRNIFWAKEKYFLFIDELIALEPGDYILRCYWRALGDGKLDGAAFTSRQQARPPAAPVKQITRPDADGGACMKFLHQGAVLSKKVNLEKGDWTITVVGCGHDGGDDSFYVDLDGKRAGEAAVSPEKISPAQPIPLKVGADGEHEIKLSLRERPGTICDKIILKSPGEKQLVIDALDLDIPPTPPGRIDEFTLLCAGADKFSLTRDTENFGKWWKSYPYADPVVNILQESASRTMNYGEKHCFANLFFVSNSAKPIKLEMRPLDDGIVLIKDGIDVSCLGVGPAVFKLGDAKVNVNAEHFVLASDRFAVRSGTGVEWRGSLLSSARPTSIEKPIDTDEDPRTADLRQAWEEAASRASDRPARRGHDATGITAEWVFTGDAPILCLAQGDVDGDGKTEIALGSANKKVMLLNAEGRPIWEFATGGKVNSVAISDIDADGKAEIIAGSDDRCCYVLSADGKERWRYQGAEGDDPYWARYWKAGEVEKVLAADINGDGKKEVIFAAANMHIHACDVAGALRWRYTQYGVCTSLLAADLTHDGKMKIVGGPAKITCTSNCTVLGADGKAVSNFGNDGWASALTAVCTADLDGDGNVEIICGTNMNNIYALNAPAGKLAQRWKFTAGDVINSLCAAKFGDDRKQHVIAGSDSECVYAIDADGKKEWSRSLFDRVSHVAARDLNGDGRDEIIAATPDAIHAIGADARILAGFAAKSPVTCLDVGPKILLGTGNGMVRSLKLGK